MPQMTTAIGPGSLATSFMKVCLPSVGREDFVGDNFGLLPPEFQLWHYYLLPFGANDRLCIDTMAQFCARLGVVEWRCSAL
jgi:hypothetical protein